MIGNYSTKSIVLIDFIVITEIARAAPSRQVPGGSARPSVFSNLQEPFQAHSRAECASNCGSKNERFSGLGMVLPKGGEINSRNFSGRSLSMAIEECPHELPGD